MNVVQSWLRDLQNPQVVLLAIVLVLGLLAILLLGQMLAPLIAALVIAYVLDAPAETLRAYGTPNGIAVVAVFLSFLSMIAFGVLAILPLLSEQLTALVLAMPNMVSAVQELLLRLPEEYPDVIRREQVIVLTDRLNQELLGLGQTLLLVTVDRIGNVLTVIVYLFLVPFMVFFFLKDKKKLQEWFVRFFPAERGLVTKVWKEVDQKTGAYVRGKIYEIGIIGGITWITFGLLGVDFSILLAALTGLSVLVPYIGVAAVFVPVTLVALFQFGLGGELAAIVGAYAFIQVIDGNILAPLLISEIVDLHPIAVIGAILVFGGIWGFWGVFFAIPLATLAVAIQNAWPKETPPLHPAG